MRLARPGPFTRDTRLTGGRLRGSRVRGVSRGFR